ncbi:MAG: ABC transporter permease [Caldilineaceae bacterium]|jgi:ABC-type dipeptide/oligopeptide/nickel transport system permease component
MGRYLLGRVLSLVMVLFIVSVFTFLLMHSIPGGPFDESKGRLPEAARANILRKYGLDKPLHVQYLNYMKNALRFDFGIPFQQPQTTVAALIGKTWFVTVQVGLLTVILAFTTGISMGVYAAYHQNSWIDTVVTFVATLGYTVPNFVIALWLILIFAIHLKWLPMGGWAGREAVCLIGDKAFCNDWIMPVVAYSLAPMAIIAGYTRSSIVDVQRQDFVRTARAKGVRDRTIMWRHVFRNALIPMVTALGVLIPNLLTGSIFIESVFRINGLGRYFVTSIINRDYPMIMALWLLIALLWGVVYLLTDVAYTMIDPRVRLGARGGS